MARLLASVSPGVKVMSSRFFAPMDLADFLEAVHYDFECFPAWFVRECGVAVGFLVKVRQHGVDDFLGNDA